jgi:YaiO family outer membrane protein
MRRSGGLATILVVTVCLGAPVPAAERPCASPEAAAYLPADGLTAGERFARARSLARDGKYSDAIGEYRRLSQDHPQNVDYLFGEAQALHWSGQHDCALRLVSRARELAPDYEDVWKLEYRLLRQAGRPGDRFEAFHAAASARFPGAPWLQAGRMPGKARWRWETGINRETLDNGAADWQNIYAHLDRRSPGDLLLSLTLTEHRRFSRADEQIAIGAGFKPTASWTVTAGLTLSPDAAFLPESVIDAGASRQLGDGWVAGLGLRHRSYAQNEVRTLGVSVERYFGNFRAAWHVDDTHLASSSSITHRGVLDYYAPSGSRYGLTLATGDEVEIAAPGQLLEMQITAVSLSGRHPLKDRLSILWRVGTHRQDSFYRRNHAGLSLAGEF